MNDVRMANALTSAAIPAADPALVHIAQRLAALHEIAAGYMRELDGVIARAFGPEPEGQKPAQPPPIAAGALGMIDIEFDALERVIALIGGAAARLRAIA